MSPLHNLKFWSASAGRMMRIVRCPGDLPMYAALYVEPSGRLISDDYTKKGAPRLPEKLPNGSIVGSSAVTLNTNNNSTNILTGYTNGKKN